MKEDFLQDLGIFNTAGIYRNLGDHGTAIDVGELPEARGTA